MGRSLSGLALGENLRVSRPVSPGVVGVAAVGGAKALPEFLGREGLGAGRSKALLHG